MSDRDNTTASSWLRPDVARKAFWIMLGGCAVFIWPLTVWFLPSIRTRTFLMVLVHTLGIASQHPASAYGWVLAAVVVVVFCAMSMRAYPLIRDHVFDWSRLKLVSIPFSVLAGTMEELWFRRFPMELLQAHGYGPALQVACAALAFGAVHAIWGIASGSMRVALGSMAATSLLGAALALVYLAAGRVVAPCIWAHTAINLILEPWLLVAAISGGFGERGSNATSARGMI